MPIGYSGCGDTPETVKGDHCLDQVVAVSRHVVTAAASGVVVIVALGFMGREEAYRAVEMVRHIGEGVA